MFEESLKCKRYFFHSEVVPCEISSLNLAKAGYVSTPTSSPGLQSHSAYVLSKVCSVSPFLDAPKERAPFAPRTVFYSVFSLKIACGCVQCRTLG